MKKEMKNNWKKTAINDELKGVLVYEKSSL